ncbi:MAG: DUF6017 domain-containing protein [Clostridiales bacterium]|nr:DUF6017 domain-containing protein [Clostridiales bacterium]
MDYADATDYFAQRFDLAHAGERYGDRAEAVKGMAALLAEVVSDPSPTVKVSNQSVPKDRFLQLTADHAAYVAESVAAQEGKIRNPRSYLLTALYRAPDTMGLRNSQGKQARGKKTAEQQARDAAAAAKQTEWMLNFLEDLKQQGKGGEPA